MLLFKYILFAAISSGVNLITQYTSFLFYNQQYALYLAIFLGTGTGLVVKYVLDKKYIFYHVPENVKDDIKKFIFYTGMGVVTTLIFWVTEIAFDYLLPYSWSKYVGAVLGLSIGYYIKYHLDKRFVFKEAI